MLLPRTPVRFEGTPTKPHLVSPEVGEHTVEILTELGMTLPEMNVLASQGAIGSHTQKTHLTIDLHAAVTSKPVFKIERHGLRTTGYLDEQMSNRNSAPPIF